MDYEKRYNEALEKVKKLYAGANGSLITVTKAWLEKIFPELAESEDERIRRTLVEYFGPEVQLDFVRGVPIQKIRDWLEKQKEQKPNFSEKDSTDFEIEVHEIIAQARNDSRLNDADVLKQFEEEAAFALMLKANKLIEQKPIQSEDEREYVKTLKGLVSDFIRDCGGGIIDVGYYQRINDWLDGRHIEQKPVEWSKEDEEIFNNIIEKAKGGHWIEVNEITWLINRFKSLRPSWKPIEEQMVALDRAIPVCMGVAGKDECSPLISLYEQLKKL